MADVERRQSSFDAGGLMLDDADIAAYKEFFTRTAQIADMQFEQLIRTLSEASGSSFIEGSTAEGLREYIGQLKALCGQLREYGNACANLAESFKDRIDEIDKDLY